MDSIMSLDNSEREVIPDSEAHGLLCKIHDILDKAISKQVGNISYILAFLLIWSNGH